MIFPTEVKLLFDFHSSTKITGTTPFIGGGANRVLFLDSAGTAISTDADFTFDGTKLLVVRTSAAVGAGDYAIKADYQYALGASDIPASVFGYFKNTGSTVPAGGHGIGVIGHSEDTATGRHNLYGVEGKVTGRGGFANQFYQGILGQGIYVGTSRNASSVVIGFNGTVYNYQDEAQTIPYTGAGISVAILANAIVGGTDAQNYGLWAFNTLKNEHDIKMMRSSAQGYIYAYGTGGVQYTSFYHDNSNGFITLSTGNLIITAGTGSQLVSANNFTLGLGAAGVDYVFTFNGETSDCTLTWDEDNQVLLVNGTNNTIQFVAGSPSALLQSFFSIFSSVNMTTFGCSSQQDAAFFLESRGNGVLGGSIYVGILNTNSALASNQQVCSFSASGSTGAGTNGDLGSIIFYSDGAFSSVSSPGRMLLCTTPAGSLIAVERITIYSTGEIIFNDNGLSTANIRMESDTDANQFFLDAANNRIGIGKNNPAYKFDVTGDINATGVYRVGGTAGVSGSFTTVDLKTVTVTSGIVTAIV